MSPADDADDWFARMRGPEADGAREAFAAWYADPQNAAAYDRRVRSWDTMKFLTNTATGRARNLDIARPGLRQRSLRRIAAIAAGVLVFGGLALMAAHRQSREAEVFSRMEVATLDEQPRTIGLPDGSSVILDRGARLQIAFAATDRRLRLLAGRARFSVAHDRHRPFIVEAGTGRVTAHGTVFDVELLPSRVDVELLQGAVEVRSLSSEPGRKSIALAAGHRVVVSGGAVSLPAGLSPGARQWPGDMLVLDAAELGEAVAAFNRTAAVPVVMEAVPARPMKVTGAFRRSDPEGFARQLAETFGLAVEARPDGSFALVEGSDGKK